ncbi:hypothetical protein [Endozoicomonas sp. 4G]|uniref:hypothetical protein n=1 Tax=Endozoicomonas sp. 4G TaxID=2872754 RepID=UPI002078FD70|nr:hypothetical protein [Endozoicomonas sp. 4G]
MKKQVIKKYCNLKVLWSCITVVAILLVPATSFAGYYVLHIHSPKAHVRVLLSVKTDTETDGPSEERGAVGGLTASQTRRAAYSPFRATSMDPFYGRTRSPQTGSADVSFYLKKLNNTDTENLPVYEIPEDELLDSVLTFVSLVATETNTMHSTRLFMRRGSHRFDLLANANPRWSRGKFAAPLTFLATAASAATSFGSGIPGLGLGSLLARGFNTLGTARFFSNTRFPNQFQVSFTFSLNGLTSTQEIDTLQQIVQLLKRSGDFNLTNSERQEESQTMTFNVQISNSVDADQLKTWLETSNQQLGNPFSIKVSPAPDDTLYTP